MIVQQQNPLTADLDHILEHTRDLWGELHNQRLFITGGTGFFGCWLLESLVWACDHLDLNVTAVALTRNPDSFAQKAPHLARHRAVQMLKGDVSDFAFPAGSFSHVIHAATDAGVQASQNTPLQTLDTVVLGTRRALEFARAAGAKKFLLTSSGAVYGRQPPELSHVPEDYSGGPDFLNPALAYHEGKRTSELLCAIYAKQFGIECKITRSFAFTGGYLPLDIHFAIGNFIRDAMRGGPIQINGDGTPFRSYLYAADLAIWLWTILFRGPSGRAYNVGSENAVSIRQTAEAVVRALGKPLEIKIAGTPIPGKLADRYVPSTRRAQNELGLKEWISLEEGIRRTAQFAERQRH
jgi:dTDP-glucose 4,6-dehydratase